MTIYVYQAHEHFHHCDRCGSFDCARARCVYESNKNVHHIGSREARTQQSANSAVKVMYMWCQELVAVGGTLSAHRICTYLLTCTRTRAHTHKHTNTT